MFRLRFKDGTVSAWDSDLERVKKMAELFRAVIETK